MNIKSNIMINILFVLLTLLITGCTKSENNKKVLLCQTDIGKIVFSSDENEIVNGIYYENIFDFNQYYTENEIEEFKTTYNFLVPKIIEENILDCNNVNYACNSIYDNYKITNKIYINSYEDAKATDLEDYYNFNYSDLKAKLINNQVTFCEEITNDKEYIVEGNHVKININDKTYNSIEEMNYDINKLEYYKEYILYEIDDKKVTIEFKENGQCELNLNDFNAEIWGKTYCDSEQHKLLNKIYYLGGDCSYTVKNNYYFDVIYDGKYEYGTYCESYESNNMVKYDVINNKNHLIEIKFDKNYNEFKFLNGGWGIKNNIFGPIEYNIKYSNN